VFRRRTHVALLYLPAMLLSLLYLGFSSGALTSEISQVELRWLLDRVGMVFSTVPYIIGALALAREYRKARTPWSASS